MSLCSVEGDEILNGLQIIYIFTLPSVCTLGNDKVNMLTYKYDTDTKPWRRLSGHLQLPAHSLL